MRGDRIVLHDINLSIAEGEHIAILGPNGCGKTTLIKTIQRELYPLRREGSWVKILGEELWNIEELRAQLGIVKNDLLPSAAGVVSAIELVVSSFFGSVGLWNHQKPTEAMWEASRRALEKMGALYLADRDMDELSSGESRRVQIARALVHQPRTVLLDEPSNSLDLRAQSELREVIGNVARAGTGVIMITHHVEDVIPEMDRVILMRDGRIFQDGGKSDLLNTEMFTDLFGFPIRIGNDSNGRYRAS